MSNKDGGFNLSIGGDVSGDVAQTIDKSQNQTTNIAGDMHGDVNNSQGAVDPWQALDDEITGLEVEPSEADNIKGTVKDIKVLCEIEKTDESALSSLIEKLKPYKPLGRALAAAVKATPAGAIAAPIIAAAYELSK